jgi:hypothetical protein
MKDNQIQLSRGHLFALGAMSVALAALSFFLGFTVAERVRAVPGGSAPAGVAPLVSAEVREGTLETLLARVATQEPQDLAFPGELGSASLNVSEDGVPTGGWAIQLAEHPDAAGADAQVAQLRAAGVQAYRVAGRVDGKRVERVRVAGYGSREAALAEMESVGTRLGSAAPSVVPAP